MISPSDLGERMDTQLRGVELKIDSMPQAIVASVGIVTAGALGAFLVWSGWSVEAIVGAVIAVAGLFGGQYVAARKSSVIDAKQDAQVELLQQVQHQTNGDLKKTVAAAVEDGIARGLAQAIRVERGARGE